MNADHYLPVEEQKLPTDEILYLDHRNFEAIEIANGTQYGLVAGVLTCDIKRATHAAQKLRAGQVFVNEWYADGVETPLVDTACQDMVAKRAARRCGIMYKPKT